MTDTTPYQPTGSARWIWRKPLTRIEVDCAQFARLEARPIVSSPERDMAIAHEELDA